MVNKLPVNAGEARDEGSVPGGEHGKLLRYFSLQNPMDCDVNVNTAGEVSTTERP